MIRQPSLQRPYSDFYSGDPAVIPRPLPPPLDASDDERALFKRNFDEYRTKITVAKETGNWTEVAVPGQSITSFLMGHVDRTIWRSIVDRQALPDDNARYIGPATMLQILVRLSVQSINGWDFKIERHVDSDWGWAMAQPELIQTLDNIDPKIVAELGGGVFRRLQTIHPKS